jgi:hypothetical protein
VSYASGVFDSYMARTGQSVPPLDGAQQYQYTVLRDMVMRLEVIMEDEGVPHEVTARVIRCLIYGAPGDADAVLRVEQDARMAEILMHSVTPRSRPW